jgi:hypothetical protein
MHRPHADLGCGRDQVPEAPEATLEGVHILSHLDRKGTCAGS